MSPKSINYIVYGIKAGILILPVLSLIVAGSLFFPFISGKNFFFRIGVEILLFFLVFVACFDKNYRPRKSPVLIALAATLFFLILATAFGANPYRSFWSNYERMEGLIGHIHLFLYFLILTGVFKKAKDWLWLFGSMLGVNFILVVYGFLQFAGKLEVHQGGTRLDATLGNATYYAIFLIFHLLFIGLFFIKTKNWWLRGGLGILFALNVILVFLTATRGAILGLFGGAIVFTVLMLIFSGNKKIRYGALGTLLILAGMAGLFLLFKNSAFIKNNYVLTRLASISITETTVESRLTIWQMSAKGFLERPILGWGLENYSLVFNKYFEPKLYKQEPWFDRSHNIFFDWLASAGILGFLAYWSIWGAAVFIIIKLYRKKLFGWQEMALFFSLFAAYAFHNIFVFDNLTSYFLFFTILGYLHSRSIGQESAKEEIRPEKRQQSKDIGGFSYLAITFVFLAVVFALYFMNIKPMLAGHQLIAALGRISEKGADVNFMLKEFDKVFAYNTFGTIEAREQLGSYAEQVLRVSEISQDDKNKVMAKAIEEMEKQVKILPDDARAWIFLATLNTKAGRLDEALKAATKALELSPKKQQIHFVLADIYLSSGQWDEAYEILKKAYELDVSHQEAAKNMFLAAIILDKPDLIQKLSDEFENKFGPEFKNDRRFINAYAKAGNHEKIKEIWLAVLKNDSSNAQDHISLAATYLQLNERENAVKELERAVELNPEFKAQADYYIAEIRAGRNP